MPVLRELEDEEQEDKEDDEGEEKKIKGLRNYATLYICTVPHRAYLLYILLPNKQYYYYHAYLITWRQSEETNPRQAVEEIRATIFSDLL